MTPKRIKSIRRGLGLTQPEFASLLHAHPLSVSKWETGRREPDAHQVELMRTFAKAPKRDDALAEAVKDLIAGAAVAAALYFVLKAALGDQE